MGVAFDFFSIKRSMKSQNLEGKFPYDPGGRIICKFIKLSAKVICNLNWIHLYDDDNRNFTYCTLLSVSW